jgi:hypothetical protein
MTSAFVIRNQLGQYLTRKGEWVSGKDASVLFHQPWYDQALNHLIEVNSKDIELRGKVVELKLDDKGRPQVQELGPDSQQPALLDVGESPVVADAAAEPCPAAVDDSLMAAPEAGHVAA